MTTTKLRVLVLARCVLGILTVHRLLLQKIIKATLLSPPAHTVTQLDHEEFCLSITKRPWTLRQKYDFFIDDAQVDTMPFKFWFQLSGPQVDPQEVEEEEDV